MAAPLPRRFFDRPTEEVAQDLLGCRIHRRLGRRHLVAEVVETEAYVGPEDLACHASRGITPRTEVLYGPPGRAYVYLCYGLHWLLNAVTEREGHGSAVLFRALRPLSGFSPETRLDGPARLTVGLSVDAAQNRHELWAGEALWLEPRASPAPSIEAGPRIGVDYAGSWAQAPLRFWIAGSPFVSVKPKRPTSGAGRVLGSRPVRSKRR